MEIYNREHHYEIECDSSFSYVAVPLGPDRQELAPHWFGRNGSALVTRQWAAARLWAQRLSARREHGHYRLGSDVVVY